MKKFIILFTLISCMLVSCRPKTDYQQDTPNHRRERIFRRHITQKQELIVVTKSENKKELKGVKNLKTQKLVVAYGEYVDITIDDVVIKTKNKNKQIFVYNHQGTLIGGMSFDSFIKINSENKEGYYIGTKYDKKYYYFHTTKNFVVPEHNFVTFNEICIVTKGDALFYNHDGEFLWQIKAENIFLLHTTDKQNNLLYVITTTDDNNYSMLNSSGKVVKHYTKKEWHSFLTTVNKIKKDNFYYAEVEKL